MVIGTCLFLSLSSAASKLREFPVHRYRITHDTYLLKRDPMLGFAENTEYRLSLEIGTPPQKIEALIDTQSRDFVVSVSPNNKTTKYIPSNSSTFFGYQLPEDTYSRASWPHRCVSEGTWGADIIQFNGLKLGHIDFFMTEKLAEASAVFGLGFPSQVPEGICKTWSRVSLPDVLKQNGEIEHSAYSLWLNDRERGEGSILFGGINLSRLEGTMYRLPLIVASSGAIDSFTVELSEVLYVSETEKTYVLSRNRIPVLFDIGSSFSYLPYNVIHPLYEIIGALPVISGYTVPCQKLREGGSIGLSFSGAEFTLPLSSLFKPRDSMGVLCIPGFLPGAKAVIGDNVLRNLYVVYDLENLELGVALAKTEPEVGAPVILPFGASIYGQKALHYSESPEL